MTHSALCRVILLACSISVVASSADTSKVQQAKITNYSDDTRMYAGTTFVVALQVDDPFVFYDNRSKGNERFSGITIDILNLIGLKLECSFVFELADPVEIESLDAPLKAIGGYSKIGDRHWADIGAGAIPITANRSLQVHFTQPYYDTGFVVVVKRPKKVFNFWSLFRPFSYDVWILVLVEILLTGMCLCVMEGPSFFRGGEESDVASGFLAGLVDAIYWSFSTFTATMHMAPKTWAAKLVMIAHGFFIVIIINSYVANLASVLTTTTLATAISGWPDITDSNGAYKLAIPRGQAQSDFLESETYHYGHEFNLVTTDSWEDSMEMVLKGQADATIVERASAQFYLAKVLADREDARCALMSVGGTFFPMGLGLAFGLDSTAFLAFSHAIIDLKEGGNLTAIFERDDYKIGHQAEDDLRDLCDPGASADQFVYSEFLGLQVICGAFLAAAWAIHAAERLARRPPPPPGRVHPGDAAGDEEAAAAAAERALAELRAGLEAAVADAVERVADAARRAAAHEYERCARGGAAPGKGPAAAEKREKADPPLPPQPPLPAEAAAAAEDAEGAGTATVTSPFSE